MQDLGRAARGAAARRRATACACSTRARRPAARPRTSPSSPTSSWSRSTATPRGSRACARTSRACASTGRACGLRPATRARRRRGGTAGRSIASWPTCPARRRASCGGIRTASGCGARATSRPSPRSRRASSTRCGRCSRRRRAALRDLLGLRRRKRGADRRVPARHAGRVARTHHLSRRVSRTRAGNSCLRPEATGHNQDGFFYALLRKA